MEDNLIFKVLVQEGKGFSGEIQALCCSATFGDTTLLTPFSVGKERHVFNCPLTWATSKQQVRRLSAAGQNVCKVVVQKKDGSKLGWVVLDLRKAKLNNQYSKEEGEWCTLSGGKVGEAAPQLRLFYSLADDIKRNTSAEEAIMQQLDSRLNPAAGAAAAASQQHGQLGGEPSYEADFASDNEGGTGASPGAPAPRSAAGLPAPSPPPGPPAAGATSSSGGAPQQQQQQPPAPSAYSLRQRDSAASQQPAAAPQVSAPAAGSVSATSAAANADGPFRSFGLTIDIRTFQAGRRLPLNMACTYVQAVLPPDVLELVVNSGHRLPAKMAPLKTHPAVDIPRGAEGAIPNGAGSLEFVAGVVQLARVLARDPRISVEVWHKERLRADTLLGVASVPLAPLLHDCWVDGYAPVYALLAAADGAQPAEKIQVGMLRVLISLEDKGPSQPPNTTLSPRSPRSPARTLSASPLPVHERVPAAPTARPPQYGAQEAAAQAPSQQAQAMQQQQQQPEQQPVVRALDLQAPAVQQQLPPPVQHYVQQPVQQYGQQPAQQQAVTLAPQPLTVPQVQQLPEYEAAYQLEAWKKGEELKWRSELASREAQRMALLEGAWRKRERAREQEVSEIRAQYLELETRTRQVLVATEERERKLIAAEEAVQRRRKDMEHDHGSRMSEAEAAVRRLQIECEHQLEIERDRNAELARQRAALEEHVAVSEARLAAVEQAFAAYRDQVRGSSEGELHRQLLEARDVAARAEDRAARALKSKAAYKQQVQQLAEQLAVLYKRHQGPGVQGDGGGALRMASEEQARYTSSQQAELFALKQQLQALKAHAMGSLSPPQGATNPAGPQRPGSSDAAGAQNDARRLLDQGLAGVDGANAVVGGGAGATPAQSVIPSQPSSAVAHIPPPSGQRQQPQQALASTAATPSQQQQALLAQPQMQQGQGGVDTPTRSRNSAMAGPPPAMGITPGPAPPYSNAQSPSRTPLVPNTAQLPQGDGVTFSGLTGGCQGGTTSAAVAPASSDTLSDPLAVMRQLGLVGCDPASDAALLAGPSVPQPHLAEITRLLRRKSELLGTGAYEAGDPLIAAIEARVAQLAGLPVATGA